MSSSWPGPTPTLSPPACMGTSGPPGTQRALLALHGPACLLRPKGSSRGCWETGPLGQNFPEGSCVFVLGLFRGGTLWACGVGWSEVRPCQGELQTLPLDSHTLLTLSTRASHYPRTEGIFGVCIHLIQLQGPRRGIFLPANSKRSSAHGQEREVWGER